MTWDAVRNILSIMFHSPIPALPRRALTTGEEIANSASHGVAALAISIGIPFLMVHAVRVRDTGYIVGAAIFSATVFLLFLTSTIYHGLPLNRAKKVFRLLDHSAIYLLIAGTYTPFTLGLLRGAWGWSLFGVIWAMAFLGIMFKTGGRLHHPVLSASLYLAMGWLVLIAIFPLWHRMTGIGFMWLLAGGLCYTVGIVFYAARSWPYHHLAWHLFVMGGAACHYFAVLWHGV